MTDTQQESFFSGTNGDAKRARVLKAIKDNNGAALFQLVRLLNWPVNRICPRVNELVKAGLVRDTGKRIVNIETNKKAIVWGVV